MSGNAATTRHGPELLHLGVRLIAINGHRHKGLVESGLDGLLRNAVLDQGAARASSSPAEPNEYLLPLGPRRSESFGERRVPLERATLGGLDHEYDVSELPRERSFKQTRHDSYGLQLAPRISLVEPRPEAPRRGT